MIAPWNRPAFLCLVYSFLWPWMLGAHLISKRRSQAYAQERRRQPKPYPIPKAQRRKTLSGSSKPQLKSQLLHALPYEIRQLIWNECLGGLDIDIAIRNRHLRLQRVTLSGVEPKGQVPYPGKKMYKCTPTEKDFYYEHYLLAILLLCRQTYSEAAPILYSHNNFYTNNPDIIEFSPSLLLSHRLSLIQTLSFRWQLLGPPPFCPSQAISKKGMEFKNRVWITIWKNLANMKGLQDLRVRLSFDWSTWQLMTRKECDELLEAVREVERKGLERFEITLTSLLGPHKERWLGVGAEIVFAHPLGGDSLGY